MGEKQWFSFSVPLRFWLQHFWVRLLKQTKKEKRERYFLLPPSCLLAAHGIREDGDTQAADGYDPGDPRCCTGSAQHRKQRVQCLLLLLVLLLQLLMVTPLIQASREQNSRERTHSSCIGQHKPKKTLVQFWRSGTQRDSYALLLDTPLYSSVLFLSPAIERTDFKRNICTVSLLLFFSQYCVTSVLCWTGSPQHWASSRLLLKTESNTRICHTFRIRFGPWQAAPKVLNGVRRRWKDL